MSGFTTDGRLQLVAGEAKVLKRFAELLRDKGQGALPAHVVKWYQQVSDGVAHDLASRLSEAMVQCGPEWEADAIIEALYRERDLLNHYGKQRVILAILQGAEMCEETCPKCRGGGKITVTCESSGGTFYDERRKCPGPWDGGCDGKGTIRRLQWSRRSYVDSKPPEPYDPNCPKCRTTMGGCCAAHALQAGQEEPNQDTQGEHKAEERSRDRNHSRREDSV